MPANISERNGQAANSAVREPAWHRLGKVLERPATAAEAIEAAGLDWEVLKQPLFTGQMEHIPVPDHFAVVRGDEWGKGKATVLGIVGSEYTPLQNRDAFRFFDPIVGNKAAIYHTAGALGSGERVWILAKLPGEMRVVGDDITDKYLLLSNSHDGNSAIQIKFTPIRVVCENTLIQALRNGPALRVAHTRDLHQRLRVAANMLNVIQVRFNDLDNSFKAMATVQLGSVRLEAYLHKVFPDPRRQQDEARFERALAIARRDREQAEYFFVHGRGNDLTGVPGTLWAAYNGVTEYVDHRRFEKAGDDRQVSSMWFGEGYSIKARAFTIAEQELPRTN
jgi:phage/plasmid-like protein (TIGR03299 family)